MAKEDKQVSSGLPFPDTSKPLFVYGALKPGEIAHPQIAPFVRNAEPARLQGALLLLRDGLPFLDDDETGKSFVDGWLLDLDVSGYEIVCSFEPRDLYKWSPTPALVQVVGGGGIMRNSNVLLGRSERRGNPDPAGHVWHSRDDPVLRIAPKVAVDMYSSLDEQWLFPGRERTDQHWEQLFRLQAAYLLLWTTYERLMALRYGPALNPMRLIGLLESEPAFTEAFRAAGCQSGYSVFDSRDLHKVTVGSYGEHALEAWYLVRSNLSHRGKGAHGDSGTLASAFTDSHGVLNYLLPAFIEGWSKVTSSTPGADDQS